MATSCGSQRTRPLHPVDQPEASGRLIGPGCRRSVGVDPTRVKGPTGYYALAFRIHRDVHGAQDATQHALLGAWRDLPTGTSPLRPAGSHSAVGRTYQTASNEYSERSARCADRGPRAAPSPPLRRGRVGATERRRLCRPTSARSGPHPAPRRSCRKVQAVAWRRPLVPDSANPVLAQPLRVRWRDYWPMDIVSAPKYRRAAHETGSLAKCCCIASWFRALSSAAMIMD
jgi:hypothetical protein